MRVGITFSTFDLFHAGHVKMIEEAKLQGIKLYYNKREHRFSSSALRNQVKSAK